MKSNAKARLREEAPPKLEEPPSHREDTVPAPSAKEAGILPLVAVPIVIDVSSSVIEKHGDRILKAYANLGQTLARDDVARHNVEVALVSFADEVRVQDFTPVAKFNTPTTLGNGGHTALGPGLMATADLIQRLKDRLAAQSRPLRKILLFIASDADGNIGEEVTEEAIKRLNELERTTKGLNIFPLSPGRPEEVNWSVISRLSLRNKPKLLDEFRWPQLIEWIATVSLTASRRVDDGYKLPSTVDWEMR